MAKNDLSGNHTNHIDIKYDVVRTLLQEQKFEMKYCLTNIIIADILTKRLEKILLERFRADLGLQMAIQLVVKQGVFGQSLILIPIRRQRCGDTAVF